MLQRLKELQEREAAKAAGARMPPHMCNGASQHSHALFSTLGDSNQASWHPKQPGQLPLVCYTGTCQEHPQ